MRWLLLRIWFLSLALPFLAHPLTLLAQQPTSSSPATKPLIPRSAEQRKSTHQADRRIALDVVVTDESGKPVAGLMPQDFTVLDDRRPQPLASFQAVQAVTAKPPVEMILVIDTMNTSFQNLAVARQGVEKFLAQNGGQLPIPVSIVYLSDYSAKVNQPSRDGRVLAAELAKMPMPMRLLGSSNGSPEGFEGLLRRFQLSLHTLTQLTAYETSRPGKKMMVWIGHGWPLTEGQAFHFTSKDQVAFFASIVDFSDKLRDARITLYDISPAELSQGTGLRTFYYQQFLKPVTNFKQANSGNLALPVLALQSGGQVLINSSSDVAAQLTTCAADAQAFYTVAFDSAPAAVVNEYHPLEVKLDKPGLAARTSSAYYAQP